MVQILQMSDRGSQAVFVVDITDPGCKVAAYGTDDSIQWACTVTQLSPDPMANALLSTLSTPDLAAPLGLQLFEDARGRTHAAITSATAPQIEIINLADQRNPMLAGQIQPCTIVDVGPRETPTGSQTFMVPASFICPAVVSKQNWATPAEYPDPGDPSQSLVCVCVCVCVIL